MTQRGIEETTWSGEDEEELIKACIKVERSKAEDPFGLIGGPFVTRPRPRGPEDGCLPQVQDEDPANKDLNLDIEKIQDILDQEVRKEQATTLSDPAGEVARDTKSPRAP